MHDDCDYRLSTCFIAAIVYPRCRHRTPHHTPPPPHPSTVCAQNVCVGVEVRLDQAAQGLPVNSSVSRTRRRRHTQTATARSLETHRHSTAVVTRALTTVNGIADGAIERQPYTIPQVQGRAVYNVHVGAATNAQHGRRA